MSTIGSNLQEVRERLAAACTAAGRPLAAVGLLAVSKTFGPDAVRTAYAAGQRAFGENYVQEGVDKICLLRTEGLTGLEWHCIGPLQSNKTRLVAEHFDWVHTVDRLKVAQRLSEQRPAGLAPLQVCVQVNLDGGANKSGVAPQDALALARAVAALPRLRLRGLMAIPEPYAQSAELLAVMQRLPALLSTLNAALLADGQLPEPMDTVSMGMSNDLETAVAAGSTMVRVGSAIFGARPAKATPAG
jgi:PLP dependent protein